MQAWHELQWCNLCPAYVHAQIVSITRERPDQDGLHTTPKPCYARICLAVVKSLCQPHLVPAHAPLQCSFIAHPDGC